MKILNNYVTELINVETPADEYEFTNPRDATRMGGWIFISATTAGPAAEGRISISLDATADVIVHKQGEDGTLETMRRLSGGKHRIRIDRAGDARLKHLIVRSVPELMYTRYPATAPISHYGPYTWQWLEKHGMIENLNVMSGIAHPTTVGDEMRRTRQSGRRWMDSLGFPGTHDVKEKLHTLTAQDAYDFWTSYYPYFKEPLCDGIIIDEYHGASGKLVDAWIGGLKMIQRDYPTKDMYVFCSKAWKGSLTKALVSVLRPAIVWEVYMTERPTEYLAYDFIEIMVDCVRQYKAAAPGSEKHLIYNFGHFMTCVPKITFDNDPQADYKVYMDMQFNRIANDPECFGMYGVSEFTSSAADEELVRWSAKLYRHYCIEGRTNMLSEAPYVLHHIENGDSDDGGDHWTFSPSEEGSMDTKFRDGYGTMQGRRYSYGIGEVPPDNGTRFLWTRRGARGPNTCSQEIKHLIPGKVYSIKMITADYGDMRALTHDPKELPVSFAVRGAQLVPERSFREVLVHRDGQPLQFCMNFHLLVFRATADTATLVISDWRTDKEPGGPVGQEIIYNYIEVQPFLEQ